LRGGQRGATSDKEKKQDKSSEDKDKEEATVVDSSDESD
jgi:hypothetical protein